LIAASSSADMNLARRILDARYTQTPMSFTLIMEGHKTTLKSS
jgi:hypothetical protein